jgi:alkylation response protein AidB-like acyl-CoA dehydrogenase
MPGSPGPHTDAAAKGPAVAEMLFALEAARALYYRAIAEARVNAPPEAVQRARAAHVTIQRSVITVTQEAIRVCGGRALLRRHPLERYARDARAGALMRPWTQDIATQQAWETALGIRAPGTQRRGCRRRGRVGLARAPMARLERAVVP